LVDVTNDAAKARGQNETSIQPDLATRCDISLDIMINSAGILSRFLSAQDRLVLQAADLSLGTLADMVEGGAIDVQPGYQRRDRWSPEKQSALIESFLLNVPVPPIYLAEDEYGKYSVVDGKQRITAIHSYLKGEAKLQKLERFTELEDVRFVDLPRDLKNALKIRPYVRVITLLKQSDPELKYEVFERLNRGGESMEPQEVRNVAFRGPLNDTIFELAQSRFLRQQLKITGDNWEQASAYRKMIDAELVLRFLTLRKSWHKFSGDFRQEMDGFMRRNRNAKAGELEEFRHRFRRAIDACEAIWGKHAFSRPSGKEWRDQLLTGMYDAQMVAVDLGDDMTLKRAASKSSAILHGTRDLFQRGEFDEAVRTGTNTPARIVLRIEAVRALLTS
jgi:hypothetical protein